MKTIMGSLYEEMLLIIDHEYGEDSKAKLRELVQKADIKNSILRNKNKDLEYDMEKLTARCCSVNRELGREKESNQKRLAQDVREIWSLQLRLGATNLMHNKILGMFEKEIKETK